ncbi:Fungal specific transcription factor domain [Ceratobasidium sp. AG-Ba]|nr:Fungal specific transcription factor domain [Ceratobasidium sp. AG-Ba]
MSLIHDRGTSLLLGRPLAIADDDYNTPLPDQHFNGRKMFSDYIRDSTPIINIQGDIITSLYRPGKLDGYSLMRDATRINDRFIAFRNGLPQPEYQWYFEGTDNWTYEQKIQLVERMTDDHGMTVLKYFISRLLLLRTMFNASQLHMNIRQQALKDAVITSHNVLALHQHLTRSPDVAFFVSPIPIHLAAMVILYAEISNCIHIPPYVAKQDIHVALTIVPNRRWRWSRKDLHASHPLISALAERHYGNDFIHSLGPPPPPILMSEIPWPFADVDSLKIEPDEGTLASIPRGLNERRRDRDIEMRERERGRQQQAEREREIRARRYTTDHYEPGTPTNPKGEGSPKEQYHVHTPTSNIHPSVQANQIPDRLFYPMSLEENILNFRGISHPHHLQGSEFIPQLPQPEAIPEVLARLRNEPPEGHVDLYQSAAYFVEEQYDREPYDHQMGFSGPTVVPSNVPIVYGSVVENSAWAPPLAR